MNTNKSKWLGRALILALACAAFLILKDPSAAKADDNEALARVIYANELDSEGNPTENTTYSFDASEGFVAYAVYVTPAEGNRALVDASLPQSISVPIRIWDNNCEIEISRDCIDLFRYNGVLLAVIAGDDSFIDSGWLHFNRGACEAATYPGDEDDAAAIAQYFNGFVLIDENPGNVNYYNDMTDFEPIGNPDVKAAEKKYIYAYARLDYDGDEAVTDNDLSFALAAELACKFKDSYGWWCRDYWYTFGLTGRYDEDRENVWERLKDDAGVLRDRISIDFEHGQTITAENVDGDPENITRYTATVNWGHTESGAAITDTVYVYELNDPEELLVCTDFNESTGTGSTFYVRKCFADKKLIVGPENGNPYAQGVDEDYVSTVIVADSIGKVAAGGNAVSMYEKNVDRNLYTFQTISYFYMKYWDEGQWKKLDFDTNVKIFNDSGKYFAVAGRGEAKKYDFVSNANGNASDDIWEADGRSPVKLFIHNNELHIYPLNANSGVAKELQEVRITGNTSARAVTINNNDPSEIIIIFNSNFYDTVSFELVYADGSSGAFTVEREGIIIQYTGLNDTGYGRYWMDIYGEGQGHELNYDYDFNTEKFVVMATYYHSSAETGVNDLSLIVTYDDGATEVISSVDTAHHFSGYKSGEGYGAVDTTTFIIGFMNQGGQSLTFSKDGHTGGFSVQVVKAGFDAENSFGGALAGSGKGKYWDGIANLSY